MTPLVVSVDPRGRNSRLLRGLNQIGFEFVRRAGPAASRLMKEFYATARSLAPVRLGHLRSSLYFIKLRPGVIDGGIVGLDTERLGALRGYDYVNAIRAARAVEFGRRARGSGRNGLKVTRGSPYFERIWRTYYARRFTSRARRDWRKLIVDVQSGRVPLSRLVRR